MKQQRKTVVKPNHPISLEGVFFTRSVVVAIQEYAPKNGVVSLTSLPENTIDVQEIEGEPGVFQAVMSTVVNPTGSKEDPYQIDMQCVARLRADDTISLEEAKRGVMITAHSVLYGAIREAVSWLTARQPYGSVMLGLSILGAPQDQQSE